jgi:DNA topoisomerase 2-associated protein PAT1
VGELLAMTMCRRAKPCSDRTSLTQPSSIDFEETYDGLGNQLQDTGEDAFNDDTFGEGPANEQAIGKDFDFAGQTAVVANTIHEEQMLFHARQPPPQQRPPVPQDSKPKPARTGYESYNDPNYIPQLEARADIWGLKPKQPAAPQPENYAPSNLELNAARRGMSLEEVEAMMRARTAQNEPAAIQPVQQHPSYQAPPMPMQHRPQVPHIQSHYPGAPDQFAPQILQRPHQQPRGPPMARPHQAQVELPAHPSQPPTILQRPGAQQQNRHASPQPALQRPPSQPRQILQNPNRLSGHGQPMVQPSPVPRGPALRHNRGPSFPGMAVTQPEQLLSLSDEQRAAFLEEDAKRAKRNHKIAMLSKDNGLMTPQDKNFITRIQLQQLMSATGNLDGALSEAALAEDFYFQVFCQIRGAPRQTPHQPANQFAQTYLFQTNSRYGQGRRNGRGGDNHMQRMEQQVQRAVEAAKAKPKGKQLVIEGSLGKIAFSNAKTPRPLLNLKRTDTDRHVKHHKPSIADRKEVLRNIEAIYRGLLAMEDHERAMPARINENSDPEAIQKHMEWRTEIESLHNKLWQSTKIMEPINPQ